MENIQIEVKGTGEIVTKWKVVSTKGKRSAWASEARPQLESRPQCSSAGVEEPGGQAGPTSCGQREMRARPVCLLLESLLSSLKHLGSASAEAREEKRKPGCRAGAWLSHLRLKGDFRHSLRTGFQWWLENFGYSLLYHLLSQKITHNPSVP